MTHVYLYVCMFQIDDLLTRFKVQHDLKNMNPLFFISLVPFSVGSHSGKFHLCSSEVICAHKNMYS